MIDPAVPLTVAGGQWTVQVDGETFAGQISDISSEHSADFTALSQEMLTEDQLEQTEADGSPNEDYTGPIAKIAWAYPSQSANFDGAMTLGQRFASRGGMVFMNQAGEVINARESHQQAVLWA